IGPKFYNRCRSLQRGLKAQHSLDPPRRCRRVRRQRGHVRFQPPASGCLAYLTLEDVSKANFSRRAENVIATPHIGFRERRQTMSPKEVQFPGTHTENLTLIGWYQWIGNGASQRSTPDDKVRVGKATQRSLNRYAIPLEGGTGAHPTLKPYLVTVGEPELQQ